MYCILYVTVQCIRHYTMPSGVIDKILFIFLFFSLTKIISANYLEIYHECGKCNRISIHHQCVTIDVYAIMKAKANIMNNHNINSISSIFLCQFSFYLIEFDCGIPVKYSLVTITMRSKSLMKMTFCLNLNKI